MNTTEDDNSSKWDFLEKSGTKQYGSASFFHILVVALANLSVGKSNLITHKFNNLLVLLKSLPRKLFIISDTNQAEYRTECSAKSLKLRSDNHLSCVSVTNQSPITV